MSTQNPPQAHVQEPLIAEHTTTNGDTSSLAPAKPPTTTNTTTNNNNHTSSQETLQAPCPNPSLQITPDHQLHSVPVPVYRPGPDQVLVHIKATGICGSDVHFWKDGRIGSLTVDGDSILGHEAAGVVVRCGDGVTRFRPGDKVALEPGISCEKCFLCRMGKYNLCEDVAFSGVYPYDGTLQRYKVHSARWLHKYVM